LSQRIFEKGSRRDQRIADLGFLKMLILVDVFKNKNIFSIKILQFSYFINALPGDDNTIKFKDESRSLGGKMKASPSNPTFFS